MKDNTGATCQNCKHQKNHPSYCKVIKKHVARKEVVCTSFQSK